MTERRSNRFDGELERARARAIREGSPVHEAVRQALKEYRQSPERVRMAMDEILRLAAASTYDSGDVRWRRDDLYADRLNRTA